MPAHSPLLLLELGNLGEALRIDDANGTALLLDDPWACKRETTEVTELRLTPSMSAMSLLL